MNGLADKKETEIWNNYISLLLSRLPAPTKPWIDYLEPAASIIEDSNGIFLIKSSASMGVKFLEGYIEEFENAFEEVTGLRRAVRFQFDETVKPKRKKQTAEQKAHEKTALKMENLALMHSFTGLNLKYTFENFVEGENSKFAYRIAKLIAQAPGESKYNPLFLSGSVGVGKTHLMQAIGHEVLKNFKNLKKIRYTSAEEFTNKLVESINSKERNEKMRKFRDLYRSVDVLLIDDIQFIEGKGRTEEEIFNTFKALYNAGKQLVFASDRPLNELEALSDRLKSRFSWGIKASIKVPGLETRMEIVKNLAKSSDFNLSDDVAFLLAEEFNSNVRELEGAFNKASAMALIEEVDLTVEKAKEYLELNEKRKKLTVDSILNSTAKYFGVDKKDILSTSRSKEIVNARKYAMYLSREMLDLSLPKLAKEFNKNHTTIMYQCDNLKKELQGNKAMQIIKDELVELIKR